MIFSGQSTEDTIPEMGFGTTLQAEAYSYCRHIAAFTRRWKIKDPKTKRSWRLNTEWETMVEPHYKVLWPRIGLADYRLSSENLPHTLFQQFRISVPVSTFPYYSTMTHSFVSDACVLRVCSSAMTLPKLRLIFGSALSVGVFTFEPNFMWCTLYPETPCTEITWS